jgi:hypothetical protein
MKNAARPISAMLSAAIDDVFVRTEAGPDGIFAGVANGCTWLAADASVIVSVVEPVVPAPVRLIEPPAVHVAPVGRPVQLNALTSPV